MIKEDYQIKTFNMRFTLLTLLLLFNINLYSQTKLRPIKKIPTIMKKIINTTNAPQALGPYSQAILIDNTLYVSGQIALDSKSMKMIGETVEEETEKVMKNIKAILIEAGFTFENVIKATIFIADMDDYSKMNSVYAKYFNLKTAPAREVVEVSALPKNAKIEISVIAKIKN
jgi:2-iminobutanoate/2-iminopropanoate deaminase|tara:strand:- start:407 stop:922 length:516 start_codon:yes stop_codon:yes gene_type:complete